MCDGSHVGLSLPGDRSRDLDLYRPGSKHAAPPMMVCSSKALTAVWDVFPGEGASQHCALQDLSNTSLCNAILAAPCTSPATTHSRRSHRVFGRGSTPLDLRFKLAALPTREIPGEMGGGTITALLFW